MRAVARLSAVLLLLLLATPLAAGEVPEMDFIRLPVGEYVRGDETGRGRENERPAGPVRVATFEIGRTEVTVGQFGKFVEGTGHVTAAERRGWVTDIDVAMGSLVRREGVSWRNPGFRQEGDHPVVWVDAEDADAFARWMSERTGRKHRLPTEAEWEYAAKGGKSQRWAGTPEAGDLQEYAWYAANSGGATRPVGARKPNGFGVYDMSGNVWEWCGDGFDPYPPSRESLADPVGKDRSHRVLRGGSWRVDAPVVTTTYRNGYRPDYSHGSIGFRLVREAGVPATR
jgi:formylglycine-generating enzyme required for sulfatase activity